MAMYDNPDTVEGSFNPDYISEYLLQAQWAEFIELKKVVTELYKAKGAPLTILDIGIGNARIAKHLSGIKDMWDMVEQYDGTDNAQACVDISNDTIAGMQLQDKVAAYFFDATDLSQWKKKYDMVITTWFTAGNFYPDNFSFDTYRDGGERIHLDKNEKFEKIFSGAYSLLNEDGEIVIGSCYKDNDRTRLKQEASYKKMGMSIITGAEDTFTATREGFWSQRFTKDKLLRYLHFVPAEKISIISLDTYDYAMQVRIKK